MKRVILVLSLFVAVSSEVFSQAPIYLFGDYTPAVFVLKNRVRTSGQVQIDAKYQKIYYLQGEDVMEMTNCPMIDTLFVDGRKFVWRNDCLCEFLRSNNFTMRSADEARRIFEFIYEGERTPVETKQ